MSDTDQAYEAVERLEYADRANGASEALRPGFDRRAFLRRSALTGVAAGSVSTILAACGASASSGGNSGEVFGSHPDYKFVFVNHVTTNPFFVPTQYGAADACKLLGCSYQWTGSEISNVNQMVNAMNTAVTSGANGIAVALIDLHAFNAPTEAALKAGIPVVAYNADAEGNKRLSYIGQDLKKAGEQMGERIVAAVRLGRRGAVHRDARLGQPAAAHRRRRSGHQSVGQADQSAHGRHRRGGAGGALDDRRLLGRASEHEGHVRGRRRLHGSAGESDAEVRPAGQRREGRRLRSDRTDAEAAAGRQHRIHDRPAALPAGLLAGAAAVHVARLGIADGTCGNRHGLEVLEQRQRSRRTSNRRPATRELPRRWSSSRSRPARPRRPPRSCRTQRGCGANGSWACARAR